MNVVLIILVIFLKLYFVDINILFLCSFNNMLTVQYGNEVKTDMVLAT